MGMGYGREAAETLENELASSKSMMCVAQLKSMRGLCRSVNRRCVAFT